MRTQPGLACRLDQQCDAVIPREVGQSKQTARQTSALSLGSNKEHTYPNVCPTAPLASTTPRARFPAQWSYLSRVVVLGWICRLRPPYVREIGSPTHDPTLLGPVPVDKEGAECEGSGADVLPVLTSLTYRHRQHRQHRAFHWLVHQILATADSGVHDAPG